ncbi:hypothetical protein KVR01_006551 [Diaporthe batatas]|uniref:uncharacterized protein n=1 Tax=Diaporthe batatas TaxID=748121 RepID=UPI001D0380FC|nr:uncharacterized protein KVR01_006551 [Diaporthe batatas]KAG8163254.1 hypothetical protein KVR01_006551 [Diaporthe batatas]
MASFRAGDLNSEKPEFERNENVETNDRGIENDRGTFLPRPSDDPRNPLNWALSLKILVLIQVCLLAALGTINTAIINPAYSQLARDFDISIVEASYQTTVVIVLNGIGPFLWVPLANVYGRRPVYLFTTLLGFVSILGSAYARTYGQLLGARVVNGLFPAAMALGPSTVVDCFFVHERGRAMGLFTVMLTTGAHIAPILGGLLGQFLGWRWIFKFTAIMDGAMFLVILVGLPETLYVRDIRIADDLTQVATTDMIEETGTSPLGPKAYLARLRPYAGPFPGLKLHLHDFIWPALRMAQYPSVLFPAAYYAAQYGFGSILPAVTVAAVFKERFGWDTLEIGLAYGGALTVGGVLGESVAGVILDAIVRRARRRAAGVNPEPEARLQAIWTGALLLPAGLLIYGFTIEYRTHWFVPLFGMGLSVFALQPIATTCYTYSIDCYRNTPQLSN